MAIDWKEPMLENKDTNQQSVDEPTAIEEPTHLVAKHYIGQFAIHKFSWTAVVYSEQTKVFQHHKTHVY